MERGIDDRNILDKFAEDFTRVVEKYTKYIIVSGYVSIVHGRSRSTEDIDMIIEKIGKEGFIKMHKDLIEAGFECLQSSDPDELFEYLKEKLNIRYIRKGMYLPEMEVKFAKDVLDEYQLKTRKKFPNTGVDVFFSSIEMNIAFKEELLRSDKDLEDAKHLREVYKKDIDEDEIKRIKKDIKRLRLDEGNERQKPRRADREMG